MEKTYIFDVDETLYPAECQSGAMRVHDHTLMVQKELNLPSYELAKSKTAELYKTYGTTFAGLNKLTGISFDKFHQFSRTWDYSTIHEEDKELETLLKQLHGKKYIYSAGNKDHVLNTLKALGIDKNIFDGIFCSDDGDITHAKPNKQTLDMFINKYNIDKSSVVYFDDSLSCINAGIKAGWNECILITNSKTSNSTYKQAKNIKEYLKQIL